VSYAGGGFDFSNVPAGTFYRNIELPPAVLAGLQDSDAWLFAAWVKLPSVADWNANASFFQIISAGDGVGSGLTLFAVSLTTASILLRGFNGTSFGNAYASSMVIPRDNFAGQIVQIGVYRRNGSLNLRLKSAATITAVSSSYPTGQTMSLAGKPIDLGWHKGTLSTMAIEPGSPRPLNGLRYYRAAAESLSVSGRDPVAVLDADWAGCNARFS
jgi:hypothetical protein